MTQMTHTLKPDLHDAGELNENVGQPVALYYSTSSDTGLPVGQKVWQFNNGRSYVAEDYSHRGDYKIVKGQPVVLSDHPGLRQVSAKSDQDPWRNVIIDELIVCHLYGIDHDNNPRKALSDAIQWNVDVALDPRVSVDQNSLMDGVRKYGSTHTNVEIYDKVMNGLQKG